MEFHPLLNGLEPASHHVAVGVAVDIGLGRTAITLGIWNSLPTRNAKASSRIRALHRARITFLSREIHSSTCRNRQTIISQIPAMTLVLFSQD